MGALSNKGWWENAANVADNRHNNKTPSTFTPPPLATLHHSPIAHLCGMSSPEVLEEEEEEEG